MRGLIAIDDDLIKTYIMELFQDLFTYKTWKINQDYKLSTTSPVFVPV